MGTPITSPGTPLPNLISCDWCQTTIGEIFSEKNSICSNGHNICRQCHDYYCPLCETQLQLLNAESYSYSFFSESQIIKGSFFELSVNFVAGILCDLRVLNSQRNCRLLCRWGEEVFCVFMYRDRKPYSSLPNFLVRQISFSFSVQVVLPNLSAPKLASTPCSWRILMEMYPVLLDRPEVAKLAPLPDTAVKFFEAFFLSPMNYAQLWQLQHPFSKYDCFFFASDKRGVYCLQCETLYTSLADLKNCLGGASIVSEKAILEAVPITVYIQNKQLFKIADTRCKYKLFRDEWTKRHTDSLQLSSTHRSGKLPPDVLSWMCHLQINSKCNPVKLDELIYYANNVFNSQARTLSRLLCFDIEVDASDFVIGASIWLYKPMPMQLPNCVTFTAGLNKFFSILYWRFFENTLKYGFSERTQNVQYLKWREFYAFQIGTA